MSFDPNYEQLVEGVRAATETGVRVRDHGTCVILKTINHAGQEAGIDVRVGELAGYIQETMESYEVEIDGKVLPGTCRFCKDCDCSTYLTRSVKPIANLSGHSINKYQIHGGKSVMLVKNEDQTKMEEGDYFAIETFGSTGRGRVVEQVSMIESVHARCFIIFPGRGFPLCEASRRPACAYSVRMIICSRNTCTIDSGSSASRAQSLS